MCRFTRPMQALIALRPALPGLFLAAALLAVALPAGGQLPPIDNDAGPTCPGISTGDCADLVVDLPYTVDWTAPAGGLVDDAEQGTGFSLVDPPSSPLGLAVDGTSTTPTYADAPGYEPSRLSVDAGAGTLTIDATKGIMYRDPSGSANTNSQLNALGVAVDAADRDLAIATTVQGIDFPNSGQAQQGGIWFGLDEDNYVKLVVANQGNGNMRVQLLREIDAQATPGNEYELNTGNLPDNQPVDLILRVDGVNDEVSAEYRVDGGEWTALEDPANVISPDALPIPAGFTDGQMLSDGVSGPVSFAGLFATSRNASSESALIDVTFENFQLSDLNAPDETACAPLSVNACGSVPVDLPYVVDWSDPDPDSLADDTEIGTGFTMADPPSARLDSGVDPETTASPTFDDAPGYEPSRLQVDESSGTLTIFSTRGIQFRTNSTSSNTNSLLNALGVGFALDTDPVVVRTRLEGIDFPSAGQSQQGGIWFGLDEDNYVKLVVQDQASDQANIQLLVERDGVTDTGSTDDNLVSDNLADNVDAELELIIDPVVATVSARYALDGGPMTDLAGGQTLSVPAAWIEGETLPDGSTGPTTFAGLFATSRNTDDTAQYLDAVFTEFSIVSEASNQPPVVDPVADQSATEGESFGPLAVSATDPDGDDLTVTVSGLPDGIAFDSDLMEIAGTPESGTAADSPYTVEIVADDGQAETDETFEFTVQETTPSTTCPLVSPEDCDSVPVSLPYQIDWTAPGTAGISDSFGLSTGFTMVDPPSERLADDGPPTFDDAPGYEPNLLAVDDTSGQLTITTTAGIQYASLPGDGSETTSTDTNSQINALGVGFDAPADPFEVVTTVLTPDFPSANDFQQGGLWFGLDEDNYAKLVVRNGSGDSLDVELLLEIDSDVASAASIVSDPFDEGSDVELRLVADPSDGSLVAEYQIGGDPAVELGSLTAPAAFFDGVTLSDGATGPVSFAGLFATHRRADDPVDVTFGDFEILAEEPDDPDPPDLPDLDINFQSEDAPVPAGFLRDFGQSFGPREDADQGDDHSYGWIDPDSGDPLSLVGNGRERERSGIDQELDTLIHLQYGDVDGSDGVDDTGAWEIEVPDGVYQVTVSVGDEPGGGGDYDSEHAINVENAIGIELFQSTAAEEYHEATVVVNVSDGRLTVDPAGGINTKLNYISIEVLEALPVVTSVFPPNRSTGAAIDGGVSTSIAVPGAGVGVDPTSLTGNVHLYEVSTGDLVPSTVGSSGGNDVIALDPNDPLEDLTEYRFVVTDGVESEDGTPFAPFTSVFTTGDFGDPGEPGEFTPLTGISFDKIEQPVAANKYIASMAFGPDGKLYATTIGQGIFRWDVDEDGTLSNEESLGLVGRAAVGLVFDQSATAEDLRVWVNHATANISGESTEWSSKVSYLTGPDLENVQDVFVGLPRSLKDHLTNSMIYGPDGDLYFLQGSNQAAGDLDSAWGTRGEKLLSAALLHFDPEHADVQAAIAGGEPIDVQTSDGGDYDPFASGAPLKLYATGLRNAYDLIWHSNDQIYVPTNGTAGGANSPGVTDNGDGTFTRTSDANPPYDGGDGEDVTAACMDRRIDGAPYAGPDVPAIANQPTQRDFLYRVEQFGYYGHPNPERCEWVLNGGSTGGGFGQGGSAYPAGVNPDPNYRGFAFDFEFNKSPNGVIEYQSETFGGALQGWMLVARFSNNNDLIFLQPDPETGEILGAQTQNGVSGVPDSEIGGVGGFKDPLDIIEDPRNGNLYVNQYDRGGGDQTLYLLRVPDGQQAPSSTFSVDVDELVFSAAHRDAGNNLFDDPTNVPQEIPVTNQGDEAAALDVVLEGPDVDLFDFSGDGVTVMPGESADLSISFDPEDGTNGVLEATLVIGNEPDTVSIPLYALAHPKQEGGGEPPLIQVFETLGYDVDPGWTSLADGVEPVAKGDEVLEPVFEKADSGPVTMQAVAAYAPQEVLPFGWYEDVASPALNEVGEIADGELQTLFPDLESGGTDFDPGDAQFGFYYDSNTFNRVGYTQDERNDGETHRARIYPALNRQGQALSDTYLVAFEDASNGDYNDYVFVASNIVPAGSDPDPDPDPDPEPPGTLRINFQNEAAPVPEDYLMDFGEPYGPRSGADQGEGLSYGWLDQATENPIDLSVEGTTPGNGRDRDLNPDQRLDTLMHMQAGDLTPPATPDGTFNGVDAYAYWEVALPEGVYEVTVNVGDAGVHSDPELHSINVENQPLIDEFEPTGPEGADSRHMAATIEVEVTDGRLTLDATGGFNSKINYVDIVPLTGDGVVWQVNFQQEGFSTPAGWEADNGLAFSGERGYGWVEPGTETPIDRTDATRVRAEPADSPLLSTLNIIQNDTVSDIPAGEWHMALPDGVYTVEVSVGDGEYFDSVHSVEANGVDLISEFVPGMAGDFETGEAQVEVDDGLLRVGAGFLGENTKLNWIRVTGAPCEDGDCFPPQVDIDVTGPVDYPSGDYAGEATVTIEASDLGGSELDSVVYSINEEDPEAYDEPFTLTDPGSYEIVALATDGAGNEATATAEFTILDVVPPDADIEIVNLDATRSDGQPVPGFWDDWLVMHRIDSGTSTHEVHDVATLEITNQGTDDDLIIGALDVSNADFELVDPPDLPLEIAPGDGITLEVAFVVSGPSGQSLRQGTLNIESSDPFQSEAVIELRGLYMSQPEGGNEVTATQIARGFGYMTDLGEPLTEENDSPLAGDEVRSALWEQADGSQPVIVRQLAAFHGCCDAADRFEFQSAGGANLGGFNHDPAYGQTILPLKAAGQGGGKSELVWNDPDQPFQITAAGYSSDTSGNLGIRTWPVLDRDGEPVPNAWYVIQDFVGNGCGSGSANCDYNDNVYLITNIVPEGEGDNDAPDAPAGLTAEFIEGDEDVVLTWDANDEPDLAGYDVERALFPSGPWTQLNSGLVSDPEFIDTDPPIAEAVYYRVFAEDQSGNRSQPSNTASVDTGGEPTDPPPTEDVIRINAGGAEVTTSGVTWSEDQHFVDGKTYTNPEVTAIAGTNDEELYLTERSATSDLEPFAYEIPLDNGAYEVRLHFAEIYFGAPGNGSGGGAGSRVFSVDVEGEPFLADYDIVAEAGTMTAIVEALELEVTDGILNLDFTSSVNQAKISAVEIIQLEEFEPEPIELPLRLNAGGPQVDTGGVTWNADQYFVGGKSYTNEDVSEIDGTDDDVLYLTERSAIDDLVPFDYAIPLDNGVYDLSLHFAEIFFGAPGGGPDGPGNRVFSVDVEGEPFLVDYDINDEVGPTTAVVESLQVEVTDGVLDLAFTASVNQPKISAIEIHPFVEPAALDIAPAAHDFGDVVIETASTFSFELANAGGAGTTLILDSIGTDGDAAFQVTGGTCSESGELAGGENCTVEVSFSPGAAGVHTGQLQVGSGAGDVSAELSGAGELPDWADGFDPDFEQDWSFLAIDSELQPGVPETAGITEDNYLQVRDPDALYTVGYVERPFTDARVSALVNADGLGSGSDSGDSLDNQIDQGVVSHFDPAMLSGYAAYMRMELEEQELVLIRFDQDNLDPPLIDEHETVSEESDDDWDMGRMYEVEIDVVAQDNGSALVVARAYDADTGALLKRLEFIDEAPLEPGYAGVLAITNSVGLNGTFDDVLAVSGFASADLSDSAIDFGTVTAGDATTPEAVLVTNNGNESLVIDTISLDGADADQFQIQADTCDGPVAPGDDCSFEVIAEPSAPADLQAEVLIESNASTSPDIVLVSAEAVAASLALDPAAHDFGELVVFESETVEFTVGNDADPVTSLTVEDIAIDGDDAFQISGGSCTLPQTLAGGESCTVDVEFNPQAVGGHAAVLQASDGDTMLEASLAGSAAAADAEVFLDDLVQTYTGDPRPVSVTTDPAGLAVDVTYDGSSSVPTDAGTYAVVATVTDANYTGQAAGDLVIEPADAEVSLDDLVQTYTGDPLPVSVTTDPAGLAVDVTYDGSSSAPTDAGTYAVVATVTDANYTGQAAGDLVIEPAEAEVFLDDLVQTYTGDPRPVSVTTDPAGLAVDVTYDGSPDAPTDAGTYAVVATVTDANYTGQAAGDLVIEPAEAEVSLDDLVQTYTGDPLPASVTTDPAGLTLDVTYDGSSSAPVDVGTYAVAAEITEPNYTGTAAGTLEIQSASQVIDFPSIPDRTADDPLAFQLLATAESGLAVSFEVLSGPASISGDQLTLTGEAGSVEIEATQGGDDNWQAAEPVQQSFDVLPGAAAVVAINDGDGQTGAAGEPLPVSPSVRVADAHDNPVAGFTVGFEVIAGGGSATGTTRVTDTDGIARVGSWTLGATPGEQQLEVTAPGLDGSPLVITAEAGNVVDLSLGGTVTEGQIEPGDEIQYTMVVTNLSDANDASNVVMESTLPPGTSLVESSGCAGSPGGGVPTCNLGSLSAGADAQVVLTVLVTQDAPEELEFDATVASDEVDPEPGNNAELILRTGPDAIVNVDLAVFMEPVLDFVPEGGQVQYLILATNLSPADVSGATVSSDLGDGLEDIEWTCESTPGASCVASGSGEIVQLVNLDEDGAVTFTVTATLADAGDDEEIVSSVLVLEPTEMTDPNLDNNQDEVILRSGIFADGFETPDLPD